MLGYEERDAALTQTFGILGYHVVAHYLYVATIGAQEIFAHDVGLGIECDTMMHIGMGFEEIAQHGVVLAACASEWEVKFKDIDAGEMVVHIMSEAHLTVDLLFTGDMAVFHQLHNHYFLFA